MRGNIHGTKDGPRGTIYNAVDSPGGLPAVATNGPGRNDHKRGGGTIRSVTDLAAPIYMQIAISCRYNPANRVQFNSSQRWKSTSLNDF